jgi:hypothetical protein
MPPPALLVGIVAAALAAFVYYLSHLLDPEHRFLRAVGYIAVAALLPPVVYTAIALEQLDQLLWWGMGLAAALALLFYATRDSQVPWAISFGVRGLRLWVFVLLASVAAYGLLLRRQQMDPYCWGAVLFGMLVGASEILSRYRDEPSAALLSLPGLVYLAINGVLSAAAFGLLVDYQDSLFPGLEDDPLLTSIVAGFGAMVVMRSKLFSFKTSGGEEFAVGPDAVIAIFLRSVDRAIDRWRSISRQRLVFRTTQGIAYSAHVADFFKGSLAAYQNLSNQEKQDLREVVDAFAKRTDLDPQLKLMAMAFGFLNISGEDNYIELMADLRHFLTPPPSPPPATTTPPPTP